MRKVQNFSTYTIQAGVIAGFKFGDLVPNGAFKNNDEI